MNFFMKQGILALLISLAAPQAMSANPTHVTLREGGLILTGLALNLAGLYMICKKSDGYEAKTAHTATGITALLAGIATICLSHELIFELDTLLASSNTP